MQKMRKPHRPPHNFQAGDLYLITSSTYKRDPLFDSREKKMLLKSILAEKALEFGIKIFAFVIMNSHYHILIRTDKPGNIPNFIKNMNGKSGYLLNKLDGADKRQVWYDYWDSCIKEEKDFWARFNYIHHNPIKHKIAEYMEDYEFSSYRDWLEEKGEEWMNDILEKYPIIDFTKGDE